MGIGVKARTCSLLVSLLAGCRGEPGGPALDQACRQDGLRRTAELVRKNRERYLKARDLALAYLDRLAIDPIALRAEGLKGKKKLVELLDAYAALHRHARGPLRERIAGRFRRAAAVTGRPEYHDLAAADERQLHQDATSYLRALYLMDQMGLDTRAYRREVRKIKGRLDAHITTRGSHQRMAFAWYYRHLGLALPDGLDPSARSLIASRPNPYLIDRAKAYQLTHEIFVPFDYGGKLDAHPFDASTRAYLRHAIGVLTTVNMARRDVDLVGELLACMRYLGDHDQRVFRDGLHFMLSGQRPSGAFGDYERLRPRLGERVEVMLYLHTTSVAMDILPLAFEER